MQPYWTDRTAVLPDHSSEWTPNNWVPRVNIADLDIGQVYKLRTLEAAGS